MQTQGAVDVWTCPGFFVKYLRTPNAYDDAKVYSSLPHAAAEDIPGLVASDTGNQVVFYHADPKRIFDDPRAVTTRIYGRSK